MSPPPAKRRRLAQTDNAKCHSEPLKPPKCPQTVCIDYAKKPKIVNRILSYLPRRQLLYLRLTSRAVRDHIDRVFRDHMVLNPGNQFHTLEGQHPKLAPKDGLGEGKWEFLCIGHGPKYRCDCCYPTLKQKYRDVVQHTNVLDLRYITNNNYNIVKSIFRLRRETPLSAIRLWMWCVKPQPGRLLLKANTLVVFGWSGTWEPTAGFRRERFELAPADTPKVVFNLLVTNTKLPFTFNGLFMKRHPPASLKNVVFVFHSRWMSETMTQAVQEIREIIPRIIKLTVESTQPVRYTFVNAGAILEGTFPVPPPSNGPKFARCANCTTFQDYARTAYTAAFGEDEYANRVEFYTLNEYKLKVGIEQFRVETLG